MAKFTKDDIKLLAKQILAKKDSGRPFNLLTGAGCSQSAGIPLAGALVKEIHEKFGEECEDKLEEHLRSDYGACMSCLTINDRRALLSKYLDNPKINWAHIAIASLMHAGFVSRVITFNFDSILARACSLLGLYPATYDFAAAATVDTDYIAPQAIIHLHGQGTGKSLLNSDEETKEHAENIRPLIRATFQDSPLLVIGYSGSSDAVFPVIADEYKGRERLWWAGYAENPNTPISKLIQKNNKVSYYLGGCDADEFLIELAKELQCFPPTLFSDPYGHILNELTPVTDFPLTKSGSSDLLTALKNELIESQQRFNSKQNISELMMKSEWEKVIELSDPKNPEHKIYISWALTMLGNALANFGKINKDEYKFQKSFEKYQEAVSINPNESEIFNNWGISLYSLAIIKRDENLFQQCIEKYEQAINIKPDHFFAINNLGLALSALAKIKNDETLFQKCFEQFRKSTTIQPAYYEAFANWGNALSNMAEIKADEALFQQSFEKYNQALAIKPDFLDALNNWGASLLHAFSITKNKAYLEKARDVIEQRRTLKPDELYNLACLNSLLSEKEKCKEYLLYCKTAKTLPNKNHLINDKDMDNVRDEPWFEELIDSID